MEKLETLCTTGGNVKATATVENRVAVPQKIIKTKTKTHLSYSDSVSRKVF